MISHFKRSNYRPQKAAVKLAKERRNKKRGIQRIQLRQKPKSEREKMETKFTFVFLLALFAVGLVSHIVSSFEANPVKKTTAFLLGVVALFSGMVITTIMAYR